MNRRSPDIRFYEFTKDWEQRKLGSFIEDYIEKTTKQNQYPVLTSSQKQGIVLQEDYFADRQVTTQNNIGYYILPKGYFTYRSRSDNGIFKFNRNDLIDRGIISYFYPVFKIIDGDSNFFLQLLNSRTKKQVMLESEGTGQRVLSLKKFKNININVPVIDEQIKIGSFFNVFDDTIALHQQLLNDHKQLKKAMLQKMFPQKGETVPKIRFAGFTEEWKEYKSKDIFCSVSDKNHPDLPVLSASQQKGMIYRSDINIDIQYNKKSTKTYKRVIPGQFVIHLRSFQGGFAYSNIEGVTSPAYTVIDFKSKNSQNSIFWKQILTSKSFIKKLETITYGIRDGRSISFSEFSTLKFRVPSYIEQDKISTFFDRLDSLIAINQKKLETYQELKKAMLQRMFV